MANSKFKKQILASSIALISSHLVYSQEQNILEEEVIVTGIRASLTQSLDMKRDATGVIDAINAEDIGKFPDTNLAESLQRITGVSIDRANGEGQRVSVRGFGPSFNMVTLNGRQMAAASSPKTENASSSEQSRAFNFNEIAAESVSAVEIFKTSKAHLASGGIGATINIRQARPLDFDGFKASGTLKLNHDTSVDKAYSIADLDETTPEISGLVSHVVELDNDMKFGVLFNASHSQRQSVEDRVITEGWVRGTIADANLPNVDFSAAQNSPSNPGGFYWTPRNLMLEVAHHDRTRDNGNLVLQFAKEDSLEITLDYNFSNYEDITDRVQTSTWFDNGWADQLSGIVDENGTMFDAFVTGDPGASIGAVDSNGLSDELLTENDSYGINIKWQASESFSLELDVHSSESNAQPGGEIADFVNILAGPLGASYGANYNGNSIPDYQVDDSSLARLVADPNDPNAPPSVVPLPADTTFYDPFELRPNLGLERSFQVLNEVDQFQLHGKWESELDLGLKAVSFGVTNTEYSIDTAFLFRFFQFFTPPCDSICEDLVTVEETLHPEIFPFTAAHFASDSLDGLVSSSIPLPVDTGTIVQEQHVIEEETLALYAQLDFATEISDMLLNALVGARWETTDVVGTSLQDIPLNLQWNSTTELRATPSGEIAGFSLESDYDVLLPNIDLSLHVNDEWITRFSYGRSLSRPSLNAMRPSLSISDARPGGPYNAAQGNPGLLPFESDNVDLSLEWYYADGSYASIAYFLKNVDNYIESTTSTGTIVGAGGYELTDPNPSNDPNFTPQTPGGPDDQVIIWDIISSANAEDAQVDGLEVALQHLFGESGFGMQVNFTMVDGDVEYDVRSVEQTVALTGLSDSANFVGFYEKHGLQLRLAYNWRDEFLLAVNQLRQTDEPIFVEEYGQWDLSINYDVNDYVNVFLEGINVTGEDTEWHGRYDNQFLDHSFQEPRYAIGVRASF